MGEKLTKDDVKKIQAEIDHRKLEIRPKALEDVKTARAQGDLSENFEYYAAKKFNRENNSRIEYLEKMLKNAEIIEVVVDDSVNINNTIKVAFVEDGVDEENWDVDSYKLVTSIRTDSLKNKVSIESPIGKALISRNVGEIVTVNLEDGRSYELKILEIIKEDLGEDEIMQF